MRPEGTREYALEVVMARVALCRVQVAYLGLTLAWADEQMGQALARHDSTREAVFLA